MKKFLTCILVSAGILSCLADNMDEAARLVTGGDFWGAKKLLEKEAGVDPKIVSTPLYSYLMGVCEFEDGEYVNARKLLEAAKAKGNGDANLYLGRLAFLDYDFPLAQELYGEFRSYREKKKLSPGETVEELEEQLESAENAMERVEKIAVIDSIAVPAEEFFKTYKLPQSAGRLLSPGEIPLKDHQGGAVVAFMNEGQDFMMWGEPDSVGNVRLVESIRLTDGNWQEPVETPAETLNKNGYADYPFMMPDGVTLYYATDGNDSMGGYDIFVVTRDAQTGEYLQPQNIGMPFNSPYDDFMLAIDEENGVGWWATDRNLLGDKLTIYVYKVNGTRKNYDPDDEDILAKARLADYRSTQNPAEKEEYSALLAAIDEIDPDYVKPTADFYFPVGKGQYYTSLNDFHKPAAREAMKKYIQASASLDKNEEKLLELRRRYAANRADNVRSQIMTMEKDMEKERAGLNKLRSDVYRLEKGEK